MRQGRICNPFSPWMSKVKVLRIPGTVIFAKSWWNTSHERVQSLPDVSTAFCFTHTHKHTQDTFVERRFLVLFRRIGMRKKKNSEQSTPGQNCLWVFWVLRENVFLPKPIRGTSTWHTTCICALTLGGSQVHVMEERIEPEENKSKSNLWDSINNLFMLCYFIEADLSSTLNYV